MNMRDESWYLGLPRGSRTENVAFIEGGFVPADGILHPESIENPGQEKERTCEWLDYREVDVFLDDSPNAYHSIIIETPKGSVALEFFGDDGDYIKCRKTGRPCPYLDGFESEEVVIVPISTINEMAKCEYRK
jgi:hypothetical protein